MNNSDEKTATSLASTSSSSSSLPSASGRRPDPLLQFVDVEPILSQLGSDVVGQVVLVGGQALNFWAERYLKASPVLQREGPFASKDIDFQGGGEVVRLCAERLKGTARFATLDDVTPNVAVVMFADVNGYERRVDFLESPYGIDPTEARETAIPIEIVGHPDTKERVELLVLHPVLCMEARICNSVGLPKYQGARGLQQARASVQCAQEFLRRELLDAGEVDAVRHLNERIFRFATRHPSGREAAVSLGIEPFRAVVLDDRLPDKFRTIRYPQMVVQVADQRAAQLRQCLSLGPRREREWAEHVRAELETGQQRATKDADRSGPALRHYSHGGGPESSSLDGLRSRAEAPHEAASRISEPELLERAERQAGSTRPELAREVRVYRALLEVERRSEGSSKLERQLEAVRQAVEHAYAPVHSQFRANLDHAARSREAHSVRSEHTLEHPSPDADRRASGERHEAEWRKEVGEELSSIRARATALQARAGAAYAEIQQRMEQHLAVAPRRPNALRRLVLGEATYKAAVHAWSKEQEHLSRRRAQLDARVKLLQEFAREPGAGFSTRGVRLAERSVELRSPELARAAADHRAWLQGGSEHSQRENELRELGRKFPDRGYER